MACTIGDIARLALVLANSLVFGTIAKIVALPVLAIYVTLRKGAVLVMCALSLIERCGVGRKNRVLQITLSVGILSLLVVRLLVAVRWLPEARLVIEIGLAWLLEVVCQLT